MAIRRYKSVMNGFSPLDDLAIDIWQPFTSSWTHSGTWVDTEKYDIIPKKEYKKNLIEAKKKEIESLEENKRKLEQEIKELEG